MLDAAPEGTADPGPGATLDGIGNATSHDVRASAAESRMRPGEGGMAHVVGARAITALSIAGIAFLLLQILTYGYGRDQGIYAMVARVVLDGGMPYRDAFDFKPPGIFLVFTLSRALFGGAQWGIRVLEVAGLIGMCWAMTRLAERWWGDRRLGIFAAALAVLVHAQLDFWHTAQPESFAGMLTVFALLIAEPRGRLGSPRAVHLVAAGVLFGAAGLLKPPLAGGGAVLALSLGWPALAAWWSSRREQKTAARRRGDRAALLIALRAAALIALGGALPILACLAWFAMKGALGDLVQVLFVFTPQYTALSWHDASVLAMVWNGVTEWLVRYSGPLALGLACLLALHPTRPERRGVALSGGIIAMQLAGVVMQGKFFPYHYGATWPLTALLAALGLWKAWERCSRRGRFSAAALILALLAFGFARSATKDVADTYLSRCAARVAVLARGAKDQAALDRLASVADVNAGANREVAALLRERVAPGKPVFIWGFEPVIYDLAERPLSTRYLYDVPQRVAWARDEARGALMRDLAARPPAAIIVERYDVFPMVTGDAIDSRDTMNRFPALTALVAERYELAATVEDFEIYLAAAR